MKKLNDINDWLDVQEHQKIGEILMQCGKLSLNELGTALDIQKFKQIMLGDILLSLKIITNEDLENALKIQRQIDERFEKGFK